MSGNSGCAPNSLLAVIYGPAISHLFLIDIVIFNNLTYFTNLICNRKNIYCTKITIQGSDRLYALAFSGRTLVTLEVAYYKSDARTSFEILFPALLIL